MNLQATGRKPVDDCDANGTELTELLPGRLAPRREVELLAHVSACEACARELDALREAWGWLADPEEVAPPARLRQRVLSHAGASVPGPRAVVAQLRAGMRDLVAPVLLGAAAAALIVAAFGLRGLLAVEGTAAVAGLSLALAALLAIAVGVALRTSLRTVRSLFVATLVAFGGYVALALAAPIPETVEFCRLRLLPAPDVSMATLCLLYVGIAVLYAGLPAGLAAYRWADRGWDWGTALAGVALFVLLSAPVLGLAFGSRDAILALSVLSGLALGAILGGAAGGWAGRRALTGAAA